MNTGEDNEPGINGAIMTKEIGDMVKNTISVESYDEFAEKIEKKGGKMLTPKMEMALGYFGRFQDTEGNVFAIRSLNK